jgi:RNA polymerase sigma-70 factor (ECF subfamily)
MFAFVDKLVPGGGRSDDLDDLSDQELMLRYADEDDVDAFEILVSRHEEPLLNYIAKRCGGRRGEAEELLQETFLRVVRSASSYEPEAKFTTWLYTIARNLCIDRSRRQADQTKLSMDEPIGDDPDDDTRVERMADDEATSASVDHDRRAFRNELAEALDALPDEQRDVFLLRECSGLTYREVAEVVDAPVPTVKSRMRYALETLQRHLEEYRDHSFDREERQQVQAE